MFLQVFFDSPLIVNGVCVRWKGYINQEKLDGVGGFRFDEESARVIKIHSYTKCLMVETKSGKIYANILRTIYNPS